MKYSEEISIHEYDEYDDKLIKFSQMSDNQQ